MVFWNFIDIISGLDLRKGQQLGKRHKKVIGVKIYFGRNSERKRKYFVK